MWICTRCGESNEDQFQECWNCVSENALHEKPETEPAAMPRELRSLGWVLTRAFIAFAIAALVGIVVTHRSGTSLADAALAGGAFGIVIGCIVGVFVWVAFPYKRSRPTNSTRHEDHETA